MQLFNYKSTTCDHEMRYSGGLAAQTLKDKTKEERVQIFKGID